MSEWTDPKVLIEVIQILATIGLGVFVWFRDKNRATQSAVNSLAEKTDRRLDGHGERISRLEGASLNAPTRDQVGKMEVSITAVEGDLKGLSSTVNGMAKQMETMGAHLKMLVEHEIKGGGRG
tara:strand:+ start:13519 stop:13887 length:369 start_codon:yes stop_codon:yes gene_type:complete